MRIFYLHLLAAFYLMYSKPFLHSTIVEEKQKELEVFETLLEEKKMVQEQDLTAFHTQFPHSRYFPYLCLFSNQTKRLEQAVSAIHEVIEHHELQEEEKAYYKTLQEDLILKYLFLLLFSKEPLSLEQFFSYLDHTKRQGLWNVHIASLDSLARAKQGHQMRRGTKLEPTCFLSCWALGKQALEAQDFLHAHQLFVQACAYPMPLVLKNLPKPHFLMDQIIAAKQTGHIQYALIVTNELIHLPIIDPLRQQAREIRKQLFYQIHRPDLAQLEELP